MLFRSVVEDADNHNSNDMSSSGDIMYAELTVQENDTAESEIGYEDEESPRDDTTNREFNASSQQQVNDETAGPGDDVDEIDYEDGKVEAIEDDSMAIQTEPVTQPEVQQETTVHTFFLQGLGDSVAHLDDKNALEADESHVVDQQELVEEEATAHLGTDQDEPEVGASASEVSDVTVLYNGTKYELCASIHNDDPETYFFAGNDEMDVPLSQIGRAHV